MAPVSATFGVAIAVPALGAHMPTDPLLPAEILENYFRAKDGNRPHLLERTFEPDAALEIRNHSTAISFPAFTQGREAMADVLVRQFGAANENVYSFYLQRPADVAATFTCSWLVAMTEKAARGVRVGGGTYEWTFGPSSPRLASRLVITISSMFVLRPSAQDSVLAWVSNLPYPWTTLEAIRASAPALPEIEAVLLNLAIE
jgi:hypothetical protein